MQTHLKTPTIFSRPRRSARRGQTIVIALLVLLLLAFLGGLFATIVTRNLANAGRSNRVQNADYYADAGIRFADQQLTDSLDGADWRPALQYRLEDNSANYKTAAGLPAATVTLNLLPKDPIGLARYNAAAAATFGNAAPDYGYAPKNDPDKAYLDQGFTRYNIGGGRYLLRVTYDPVGINNPDNTSTTANTAYSDPRARYIKIESVGREGVVDPTDPTTYTNATRTQLNATEIQYKAIGITDYGRFETNPENRSDTMSLGVSSSFYTNQGNADPTPSGIVTPGVYDFNGGANTLQQYPIVTTYGSSDAYLTSNGQLIPNPHAGAGSTSNNVVPGGGSIHVNGNVRFYGENQIFLNNTITAASDTFGDTLEVAGNILLDNYQPPATGTTEDLTTGQDAALIVNPPTTGPVAADYVAPSNDPNGFSTHNGQVRDGSGGNDSSGAPRSVNRLEPPTLDTVNPVTNLPRYASISMNAPARFDPGQSSTATFSTTAYAGATASANGYGQAIYVDNSTDIQPESSSLVGGYTLIDEWLHRAGADAGAGTKSGWVANFYRPPGVDITLGRQQATFNGSANSVTTPSFYGVRLTRTDVDGAGNLIGWKNPDGSAIAGVNADGTTQSTMTIPYKSLNASNETGVDPASLGATTSSAYQAYQANPDNDVIIYATGNVRVHGVVSADPNDTGKTDFATNYTVPGTRADGKPVRDDDHLPRHVTIVTDGTAYIDGSLLRGNPESTITILAHDYVCVNTTQFLAGPIVDENPAGTDQPGAFVGDPSLLALDFAASDEELIQEFTLPEGSPGQDPLLYVSGGPSAPGGTAVDFDILNPRQPYTNEGLGGPPFTTPVLSSAGLAITAIPTLSFGLSYDTTGAGSTDMTRTTLPLPASVAPGNDSVVYQLAMRRDQGNDAALGAQDSLNTQDFLLERAAVLPMDIRIEAVMFAQTRSFFVIPGSWFNSNSDDNVLNYKNSNGATRPGVDTTVENQNRFPFFGQPIDMKIIVDGAISEARPADVTAQSAWMAKWGWVPQFHGGLVTGAAAGTEGAGHTAATANTPAVGLQIIYNPLAGYPYYTDTNTTPSVGPDYLRTDIYGRPLPFAPKLPVCTGLLYAGQNTGESVLQ